MNTDTTTDTRPNLFNADLAQRTLAAIEADPAHWNQKSWVSECGTAWCFAGWAVRIHDGIDPDARTPIQHKAEQALGLDPWLAKPLFAGSNTLGELREMVAQYAAAEDESALEHIASDWGAGDDGDDDYEQDERDDDWDMYA